VKCPRNHCGESPSCQYQLDDVLWRQGCSWWHWDRRERNHHSASCCKDQWQGQVGSAARSRRRIDYYDPDWWSSPSALPAADNVLTTSWMLLHALRHNWIYTKRDNSYIRFGNVYRLIDPFFVWRDAFNKLWNWNPSKLIDNYSAHRSSPLRKHESDDHQ